MELVQKHLQLWKSLEATNMQDIVIIGAGGHAKVVSDIITANGDNVLGYLDDSIKDNTLGVIDDFTKYIDKAKFVIAIGNSEVREKLSKELNCKWHTAIHPSAVISSSAKIEEGTVVMPNAVINAGATIGKHCIINTGAIVEHDNRIGNYCHVSVGSRLGGTVSVGNNVWLGIGSTIINNITIADDVYIGAGAVVVCDLLEAGTYIGVPAKKWK